MQRVARVRQRRLILVFYLEEPSLEAALTTLSTFPSVTFNFDL